MTLRDYCGIDVDLSKLFGVTRWTCHFHLLKAAFKADVDVLLPTLYYACADFPVKEILSKPNFLEVECSNTLLVGKAALEYAINELVAGLPDMVLETSGVGVCTGKERCIRDGLLRVNDLDSFVNTADLQDVKGDVMVNDCFGFCPRCKAKASTLIDIEREKFGRRFPFISSRKHATFFRPG